MEDDNSGYSSDGSLSTTSIANGYHCGSIRINVMLAIETTRLILWERRR